MNEVGKKCPLLILIILALLLTALILPATPVKADPGWVIEIVDSSAADVGKYTSLALDSYGHPHISYYDDTNGNLKYANYNGTNWNIETVDETGDVGLYTSLALDSNDHPHISYYHSTWGNLKYASYNGTDWNIEGVDTTGNVGLYTSLVLDSDDHPHISYFDDTNDYLKYASYDGTDWNIENVRNAVSWWTSLALDSQEYPHISYYNNYPKDLKYASYNGTDWNVETVDDLDVGAVGYHSSLELDSKYYPHISYWHHEWGNLKYASYNGTDWNTEDVDNPGNAGSYNSLELHSNDLPHISYCYYTVSPGVTHLKYTSYNGTDWNTETVDDSGDAGQYTSLALDENGYPHISYYEFISITPPSQGRLRYARFVPAPGLSVSKGGTSISQVGDNITYWVSIGNTGDVPLQKVSVSDNRSGVVTDISALFSDTLGVGASENRTYIYTVQAGDEPGPIINTVTAVYGGAGFPDMSQSDSHSVTLLRQSVSVSKGGPTISKVGDNITYWVSVTNTGDVPLQKVSVSDNVVAGINHWFSDTLDVGASDNQTYTYVVQAGDHDPLSNLVIVHYHPQGLSNDISDNATCTVDLVHPSISLSKTADTTISKVGDNINYTCTITNTSPDVTLERDSASDSLAGTITSSFPATLAPGASANVTYTYTVKSGDPDPLPNTVTVHYHPEGLSNDITDNATYSVDLRHPNIQVTKYVAAGAYGAGDNITYLLSINNTSTDITLVKDSVTDSLAGDITSLFGLTIAAGGSDNQTYTYTVKATDPDPLVNLVTVHYHPQGLPNDITDNTTATVFLAPTITLITPNQGNQGQTLDIVITGSQLNRVNAVDFGAGITVNGFTVDSPTQITANISIDANAAPGPRDVTVTNTTGSDTLTGSFTVNQPTQQVATATGTGTATFTASNGSVIGLTVVAQGNLTCGSPPAGSFPHGFFSFTITNIAPGSTVTITITLPSNMPVGTQYWKCQNGQWVNITSLLGDNDGDNVLTLTLTDGGLGDADGAANGTIVDPGGPAVAVVAPPAQQRSSPGGRTVTGTQGQTPPEIWLVYMNVNPQQQYAGQPVTITTNVSNTGGSTGQYAVTLTINGQVEETRLVSVGAQSALPVEFTVHRDVPGTYTVTIGGQQSSFTVLDAGSGAGSPVSGAVLPILMVGILVLVTAVGLMLVLRRRAY